SLALPAIERARLVQLRDGLRSPSIRIGRSMKHLASSDVRMALRKDPFWGQIDLLLRSAVTTMGSRAVEALRRWIEGPLRVNRETGAEHIDVPLSAQQLRGVRHDGGLARRELAYEPLYTFSQSMAAFRRWYVHHHGLNTACRDLILELF
ncbi:MAG TPA: hypothetical protein VEL75_03425, partial [Candidatus Methylomirabilis sp.]|nr:hypothetical protein [Candidatus Methylomirabilis sp.]